MKIRFALLLLSLLAFSNAQAVSLGDLKTNIRQLNSNIETNARTIDRQCADMKVKIGKYQDRVSHTTNSLTQEIYSLIAQAGGWVTNIDTYQAQKLGVTKTYAVANGFLMAVASWGTRSAAQLQTDLDAAEAASDAADGEYQRLENLHKRLMHDYRDKTRNCVTCADDIYKELQDIEVNKMPAADADCKAKASAVSSIQVKLSTSNEEAKKWTAYYTTLRNNSASQISLINSEITSAFNSLRSVNNRIASLRSQLGDNADSIELPAACASEE